MPITPHFDISQTDTYLQLEIRVPHVRVSADSIELSLVHHDQDDTDDDVVGGVTVLHFAANPIYLLVLHFPSRLVFSETTLPAENSNLSLFHETAPEACANYHPTIHNGTVSVQLRKASHCAFPWPNLDLIGNYYQRRYQTTTTTTTSKWLLEERTETTQNDHLPSSPVDTTNNSLLDNRLGTGYGFYRMFQGIFADLCRDGLAKEMLEQPWDPQQDATLMAPQSSSSSTALSLSISSYRNHRKRQRQQLETFKFDQDRYRQDLDIANDDDYVYQCAMAMQPHWQTLCHYDDVRYDQDFQNDQINLIVFDQNEKLQLSTIPYPLIPNHSLHSESPEHLGLLMGLLDILFAYVYDHVVTDGEATVESAWTISILSASLSWLEDWYNDTTDTVDEPPPAAMTTENHSQRTIMNPPTSPGLSCLKTLDNTHVPFVQKEKICKVVYSSIRRSLIYPYIRNLDFAIVVWKHVITILKSKSRCIIRCLLQVRSILDHSELYYLGNKLFIDPYLAYVQQQSDFVDTVWCSQEVTCALEDIITPRNEEEQGLTHLKQGLGLDLVRVEENLYNDSDDDENDDSSSDDSSCDSEGEDSELLDDDDDDDDDNDSRSCGNCRENLDALPLDTKQPSSGEYNSELLDANLGFSMLTLSTSSVAGRSPPSRPLIEVVETETKRGASGDQLPGPVAEDLALHTS